MHGGHGAQTARPAGDGTEQAGSRAGAVGIGRPRANAPPLRHGRRSGSQARDGIRFVTARITIPLTVPDLRGNESAYIERCLTQNWVSAAGPEVRVLEQRVAALCDVRHAVATVNGTAALHLALVVAGVCRGDLVVVPDFTFAATANAVIHAGARPLFADVTHDSWTLDPDCLAAALDRHGEKIRAVVPVHALGHPADMVPIVELARGSGVPVIEDAAGAIGARYRGRAAGGLGDAAIFSFNGNKTVTAGGGGAIVTDRTEWAERAHSLSTQAREGESYRHTEAGFNYRMPNINAALGLAQLERLDEMVAAKRGIAARYDAALRGHPELRPMPRAPWANSACWLYSVKCADPDRAEGLVHYLRAEGIGARVAWLRLSSQAPYAADETALNGVSDSISGCLVSLPCSSSLTPVDQDRVIAALQQWSAGRQEQLSA